MAYRCFGCNHVFLNHEIDIKYDPCRFLDKPHEEKQCCPKCGDDFAEIEKCEKCGDSPAIELWCEECLFENLTYSVFYEFCKENDILVDFVSENLLKRNRPKNLDANICKMMCKLYNTRVNWAIVNGKEADFLSDCKTFIKNRSLERDFAKWLFERGWR